MSSGLLSSELGYAAHLQGTSKQRYALTDGDLRGLGTLERDNPQYKGGAKMRLLLLRQAR